MGPSDNFSNIININLNDDTVDSDLLYRNIVEMAPDGIITIDMNLRIRSANKAYYELTGLTEDEVIGKHISNITAAQTSDIPQYLKVLTDILTGKKVNKLEFTYRHKDGSLRWGEGRVKLLKTGLLKRTVLTHLRDITEQKQREEEFNRTLTNLTQLNHELDDFTYAVSHDLKTPLRAIKSFGTFLVEDYSTQLDDTGKEYIQRMMDASSRMKELIEDLIAYSRIGQLSMEKENVDLNKILDLVKLELDIELKGKNGVIINKELPVIQSHRILIRQLLGNLISNGLKFNKNSKPTVWMDYIETPTEYTFIIKDNGIGIDQKYHDKIFKIFEQLHRPEEYTGTGVGLTLCQRIVESFGGRIWVESILNEGSTFYFTVPKNREGEAGPFTVIGDIP